MNQITLLVDLQHVDMRSDENESARALYQTKLADHTALDGAHSALEVSEKHSAALKGELHSLELETMGLTEKLQEVSTRLYSGRITNGKELAGLNQDEKMLQRRKGDLEDKELGLMEQIEGEDSVIKDRRATFEKIEHEARARDAQAHSALLELDTANAELARKRDKLRAQLSDETLRLYDDLRRTKKGRAVAVVKVASCSACGYEVPSGMISRVRSGNELVFCTNCTRILAP